MYSELLGYKTNDEKVYICDDNLKISKEYNIGDLFIDFMELDFSDFEKFYCDVEKIFKHSSTPITSDDKFTGTTIDKHELTTFFMKYPVLKKEVINDFVHRRIRLLNGQCDFNFDLSILESFFNVEDPPIIPDELELAEKLDSIEQAVDCVLLMKRIQRSLLDVREMNRITWKFIFKFTNPYISNLEEIRNHPYSQLSNDDDSDYNITEQFYPHILQLQYKEAFTFCFDTDYCSQLNQLTSEKRLYLYDNLHPGNLIRFQDIKIEFVTQSLADKQTYANKYPESDHGPSFLEWFKSSMTQSLIEHISHLPIDRFQLYETYHLRNIMAIEFHKMVEHNIRIKRCKNCGRYFILKGDYATDYCDRISPQGKFSCKKIAAISARKNKVRNNPILKEYERAYKRNYARVTNHKMTAEDFRLWTEEAAQKRDAFSAEYTSNPSDQLISEFKKYLGNK